MIFTSGSTGKNKAVVLTESNLIGNLVDAQPLGGYRDDDIALISLPIHHVFGLVLLMGSVVLGYGAYFPKKTDIPSLLAAIEAHRLTRMNGVPALYLALAEQCAGYDISPLRCGFVGGSPVSPEQFIWVENRLGMTLVPAYGMSECVGITSASWRDPQRMRGEGCGRFYPRNVWKLLRGDGSAAQTGEEGEICINGPARMYGYYGAPLREDTLISTGDLGYVDAQGVLHVTGRIKDIIIRNGNNLSPRRIEQALTAVSGVSAAVVVGIPDERQGEVPAAMLVSDVRDVIPDLPKNEHPAVYLYVSELPLTFSGKPDRVLIRKLLTEYAKK